MNAATKELLQALKRLECHPRRTLVDFFGRKTVEWEAKCPAHPDAPHTLRIIETSNGWIFYPYGYGYCDYGEIASQLRPLLPKYRFLTLAPKVKCTMPERSWVKPGSTTPRIERLTKPLMEASSMEVSSNDSIEADPAPVWRPYPTEVLPEPFRQFVEAAADAIGCDASYIALPLVIAAAAAIGTTRMLEVKGGWHAPSILWGAIVGESGTLKTPALWTALQWTERRQSRCLAAHKQARAEFEATRMEYEKRLAEWKRNGDGELPPQAPEPPVPRRVLVQDTTVEAVAPILTHNPRGILLARDELAGWIAAFDRYASTQGADAAQWVSMYNARSVMVDRKTSGTMYVPVAAVSVVGGIQPAVLRRVLGRVNRDNGFASRLLLVMPPARVKRWSTTTIDESLIAVVGNVFDRLFALEPDGYENGVPVPRVMTLSPDAQAAYVAFYNAHAVQLADATGDVAAALSKLEELPARLALVFHLVRYAAGEDVDPDVVDSDSMRRAITLTEWHKHETLRIYHYLDAETAGDEQRQLVEWIARRGGVVTVRDVYCRLWRFRNNPDGAEQALNGLVHAGFGVWEDAPVDQRGGRPTRIFRLSLQHLHLQNLKKSGE
jgi:hypothetical protein